MKPIIDEHLTSGVSVGIEVVLGGSDEIGVGCRQRDLAQPRVAFLNPWVSAFLLDQEHGRPGLMLVGDRDNISNQSFNLVRRMIGGLAGNIIADK